jgi:hypothetical protein
MSLTVSTGCTTTTDHHYVPQGFDGDIMRCSPGGRPDRHAVPPTRGSMSLSKKTGASPGLGCPDGRGDSFRQRAVHPFVSMIHPPSHDRSSWLPVPRSRPKECMEDTRVLPSYGVRTTPTVRDEGR